MNGDNQEACEPKLLWVFLPRYFSVPAIIRLSERIARTIFLIYEYFPALCLHPRGQKVDAPRQDSSKARVETHPLHCCYSSSM